MLKSKQPSSRQAILLTSTSSFLGDVWLMKNVLHRTYNCEIKNFLINFKQKKNNISTYIWKPSSHWQNTIHVKNESTWCELSEKLWVKSYLVQKSLIMWLKQIFYKFSVKFCCQCLAKHSSSKFKWILYIVISKYFYTFNKPSDQVDNKSYCFN